jgi:hypothetical protein
MAQDTGWEMTPEEQGQALRELAAAIEQRGMLTPARMLVDTLAPLNIIASQIALAIHPLVPKAHWRLYISALGETESWEVLQRILNGTEY